MAEGGEAALCLGAGKKRSTRLAKAVQLGDRGRDARVEERGEVLLLAPAPGDPKYPLLAPGESSGGGMNRRRLGVVHIRDAARRPEPLVAVRQAGEVREHRPGCLAGRAEQGGGSPSGGGVEAVVRAREGPL